MNGLIKEGVVHRRGIARHDSPDTAEVGNEQRVSGSRRLRSGLYMNS